MSPDGRYTSVKVTRANNRRDSLDEEYEYDDGAPSRMPSSVRRYRSDVQPGTDHTSADVQSLAQNDYYSSFAPRAKGVPPRRTAAQRREVDTEDIIVHKRGEPVYERRRFHWLVYVGLALVVMLVGWIVLSTVTNWWQVAQDDWHYGRPRTAQYDVVVGHNDSPTNPSHFIALNLNRHVEVIECPGGDCSKAKIYVGPVLIGPGQDLAPVTLTFKDVTGNGKLDMIINVQDSRIVYINENGSFRPQRPGENVQLN